MNVEEFDELINTIPKVESDNPISAMDSINVEDLRNAVERFKKIPTYQDLLKENQELKKQLEQKEDIINKAKEFVCDYKKQWVVNDEVVDDMEVLLKILDNKG